MKHHCKNHHSHPIDQNEGLSALLDHCAHYLTHRIGGSKRGRENVMSMIAQHSGITQKEVSENLCIQPASVSELMRKLEAKGLIYREKDAQDRRSTKVYLTEEGTQFVEQNKEERSDTDLYQILSSEEQAQLKHLLMKLLEDWESRYPMEHRRPNHKHPGSHECARKDREHNSDA